MNNLVDICTVALAVMAFMGAITGVVVWFYKRGGQERSFADALNENTKSNREVAAELTGL